MHIFNLLCLLIAVQAITVEIPKGSTLCFYDELGVNNKLSFKVDVLSGGNKDLIFTIASVGRDEELYKKELGDKLSLKPTVSEQNFAIPYFSEYKFCFDNEADKENTKIAQLDFKDLDSFTTWTTLEENQPLQEDDVKSISYGLSEILKISEDLKGRQAAFKVQETERREGLSSVHSSVTNTSIVEIVIFIVFSVIEIYVVKSWFNRKVLI